jgi:hypothetical protein
VIDPALSFGEKNGWKRLMTRNLEEVLKPLLMRKHSTQTCKTFAFDLDKGDPALANMEAHAVKNFICE